MSQENRLAPGVRLLALFILREYFWERARLSKSPADRALGEEMDVSVWDGLHALYAQRDVPSVPPTMRRLELDRTARPTCSAAPRVSTCSYRRAYNQRPDVRARRNAHRRAKREAQRVGTRG